jgi:hypothetical protein
VLLVFFLCTLFAFLICRFFEARKTLSAAKPTNPNP